MALRRFISVLDAGSSSELRGLLQFAQRLQRMERSEQSKLLPQHTMALLFEKPSLRTRVSFEAGMTQLGGASIYLSGEQVGLGKREPVRDIARVLSRMTSLITARVMRHETVQQLAEHATVPVINALCDREHPCQAMADLLTILQHKGRLDNSLRVTFVGDGNNNVTHSLALGLAQLGVHFTVAAPEGFEMDASIKEKASALARDNNTSITETTNLMAAVEDTDVVYTDTWVSMGQEQEKEKRLAAFKDFQVTPQVMKAAHPEAIFMHDMPAYRGYEVHADVIDGPKSVIIDQAENRLHAQKAIVCYLMGHDIHALGKTDK